MYSRSGKVSAAGSAHSVQSFRALEPKEKLQTMQNACDQALERMKQKRQVYEAVKGEIPGKVKERVRERTANRIGLSADFRHELMRLIDGDRDGFRDDFKLWLDELLAGTIPKVWSDELVKFLKSNRIN